MRSYYCTNQLRLVLFFGHMDEGLSIDHLRPLKWSGYLQRSINTLVSKKVLSLRQPRAMGWRKRYRLTKLGKEVFSYLKPLDWSHAKIYL